MTSSPYTYSPPPSAIDQAKEAARTIASGVSEALDQGAARVSHASDAVTDFRATMRRQPVTMAFVIFALGYMIGTQLRR